MNYFTVADRIAIEHKDSWKQRHGILFRMSPKCWYIWEYSYTASQYVGPILLDGRKWIVR